MQDRYLADPAIARLAVTLVKKAFLMLSEHRAMLAHDGPASIEAEHDWLVHYTSDRVASLILEHDELYLFDATTGNDRTEYRHGLEVLWRALGHAWEFALEEAQSLCSAIEDPTSLNIHRIHRLGLFLRRHLLSATDSRGLIFCTAAPLLDGDPASPSLADNLAMWREYGDDGAGVGLVFHATSLRHRVAGTRTGLFEVLYEDDQKEIVCRYLVAALTELIDDRQRISWTKQVAGVLRALTRAEALHSGRVAVGILSLLFKDACFAYEREVRLVHLATERTSLQVHKQTNRERFYRPLSAIDAKSDRLPIVAVHLGPRVTGSAFQERILVACHARGIPIVQSQLPYRGSDCPEDGIDDWLADLRERDVLLAELLRTSAQEDPGAAQRRIDRVGGHWNKLNQLAKAASSASKPRKRPPKRAV